MFFLSVSSYSSFLLSEVFYTRENYLITKGNKHQFILYWYFKITLPILTLWESKRHQKKTSAGSQHHVYPLPASMPIHPPTFLHYHGYMILSPNKDHPLHWFMRSHPFLSTKKLPSGFDSYQWSVWTWCCLQSRGRWYPRLHRDTGILYTSSLGTTH